MIDESPSAYLDNDLVRRAREGDVAAFEQLFARHHKRIYNIALQMLGDEPDAADVTQEVFVRTFRLLKNLRSDAAFVTWLRTLAVNLCRDIIRKRGRNRTESLDSPMGTEDGDHMDREITDWSTNPERSLDKKETQRAVRRAIGSLTPEYREVVTLYYVGGAEVAGIARALRCPEGTVKSRLARARAELRRKLGHLVER